MSSSPGLLFVFACALPTAAKSVIGPGALLRPVLRAGFPYGRQRDLLGFLVPHPAPLPCSETPAEPVSLIIAAFPVLPPHPTRRRLQHDHDFEAGHRASVPAVYASRVTLPPPMQDSLPAGGLRLCREGVESQECAVCRGRRWRRTLGYHRVLNRDLQDQRRRSSRLSHRRPDEDRQRTSKSRERPATALGLPHSSPRGRGLRTTLTPIR
jgi:hypothetical protein